MGNKIMILNGNSPVGNAEVFVTNKEMILTQRVKELTEQLAIRDELIKQAKFWVYLGGDHDHANNTDHKEINQWLKQVEELGVNNEQD